MNKYILLLISLFISIAGVGQSLPCGSDEYNGNAFRANPQFKSQFKTFEQFSKKYTYETFINREKGPIYQIPTVVHVIHNFGGENLSDASIINAIESMNNHWRKRDSDTSNIVPPFDLIHDDMEIEFVLAKKDPNGNCTNGITRHISELTFSAGDNVKALTKAKLDWPSDQYLNIWIVASIASGAGGYSYYPGIDPSIDGIVVLRNQLSALAHEAGHWLSLSHLWGSTNDNNLLSNCNTDDGVDDTPNTQGQSFCSTSRNSCSDDPVPFLDIYGNEIWPASNGEIHDNVQNYMDYAFCGPENFTQGQKARTHAVLNNSLGSRNNLVTSTNATNTGISASFTCEPIPVPDFDVSSEYVCTEGDLSMRNNSYNADNITYSWDFDINSSASSTSAKNPYASWSETGRYNITLTASNAAGSNSITKQQIAKVLNGTPLPPFVESFTSLNFPINDPSDPTKTWFIDGVTNPSSFTKTTLASSEGNTSLMLDIKNTTGVHRLISPMIDVTQASCDYLTFDLAYAARTNSAVEKFTVKASTNCGRTWPNNKILYEVSKQDIAPYSPIVNGDYIPNSNQWKSHTVDMSSLHGENDVLIMFEIQTNNGNTLYLDNINFGCSNYFLSSTPTLNEIDFEILPNPGTFNTNIFVSKGVDNFNLKITDITGKAVANKEIMNSNSPISIQELTTSNLNKGVYFISIDDHKGTLITKKFILQ